MDTALEILDPLVFDKAYAYFLPAVAHTAHVNGSAPVASSHWLAGLSAGSEGSHGSAWARDNVARQIISIMIITQIGATGLYWVFSALSYYFIFDRRLEYHPRFLKNQIRQEMISSMSAVPFINILTMPFFLAEVRGKSLLYTNVEDFGWSWMVVSTVLFMIWNDFLIYWIHRLEHHPSVYKYIHKPHHKWIGSFYSSLSFLFMSTATDELPPVPTPWAALAFHPLDGYVQSLPYQ